MPRSMPRTAAGMHLLSCGLDPEAGVAAAPARERPRLDVEDPRSRERALEVVEELREHPRRARAGQAATGEQRDPVRTSRRLSLPMRSLFSTRNVPGQRLPVGWVPPPPPLGLGGPTISLIRKPTLRLPRMKEPVSGSRNHGLGRMPSKSWRNCARFAEACEQLMRPTDNSVMRYTPRGTENVPIRSLCRTRKVPGQALPCG